mmetsp:Transcript_10695/g.26177  ORF Transcript_10695/g.26177 Transcript_10695/m.26177 type:complete len:265 (-) Transcript_10695:188-982(-)
MVDDPVEAAVIRRATGKTTGPASPNGAAAAGSGPGSGPGSSGAAAFKAVEVDPMVSWYNATYSPDGSEIKGTPQGGAHGGDHHHSAGASPPPTSPTGAGGGGGPTSPTVQRLQDDMREGARREAVMRSGLRAAEHAARQLMSGGGEMSEPSGGGDGSGTGAGGGGTAGGSGRTAGMVHVRRILKLRPDQRDDLWAVLDEVAPSDPAALDDPEAGHLKEAHSHLKRLLLSTHPDKYPEGGGERTQAQAATQIVMRLMETVDGMIV